MKLTLAEPKYLKESINIISELVTEGTFKLTKNGIELIAMDPANVAMVVYKLLASCFVEFSLDKETELSINLNNFKQILRRAKTNDAVTLDVGKDNKLNVTLQSNTKRTFSLPILETEEKEQKIPELAFPVIIQTQTSLIEEAIEDIGVVSESLTLSCEPKKLTITGEGDLSKAAVELESGEATELTNDSPDSVNSKYSVEYLKKMILGGKLTDKVTLCYDKDYPLKLDFKEVDKVQLSFILAPRVENN
tara:strand:- start:180 stop:926 length:747 start_codon:yes stop_codon:yes gene_type:complete